MKKLAKAFLIALCALTTSLTAACGFTSSSSSPNEAASSGQPTESSKEETSSVVESSKEESSVSDSSVEESSKEESSVSDSSVEENSKEESSVPDSSVEESSKEESSTPDSSVEDSSKEESSTPDSSVEESSKEDSSVPDSSVEDSSESDSSVEDSSSSEEKKTFNVMKPEAEGITFEGEETATGGENYVFKIGFASGYEAGADFVVTVNGQTVEAGTDGAYTVENVSSVLVIIVEGVEEIQYKATFKANYEDALKNVTEGFKSDAENYTFMIELNDKYTQSADAIEVFYKVAGSDEEIALVADESGVYSIPNPQADIEIIVKNVAVNRYLVTFKRNAVAKYELWAEADSVLTEEDLNAALAALLGENEEFVAWREDITAAITGDTTFSVVAKAKEAWGELIEGNPLTDGAAIEDEYSAAGYEKVYGKAGIAKGPFAAIDVSAYTTLKFAFKHSNSWILFDGWNYYIDHQDTWIDVTMEKNVRGEWEATIEAPVVHNLGDGAAETLNPCTLTFTGNTLQEIFASWENEAASLYVTELRGEAKTYGEQIAEVAVEGSVAATDKSVPAGFAKVYSYANIPAETAFADVDISAYEEVKFCLFLDDGYIAIQGWGAYAENAHLGDNWVPVTLKGNGGGTWTVTVNAKLTGASVTDTAAYTYTASGTKLSEVLSTWFDFASGAIVYLTDIRGIKAEITTYGEKIADVAVEGSVAATDKTAPNGFEKAYSYANIPAETAFAAIDISGYSEVKFYMILDNGYVTLQGWGAYAENAQWGKGWIPVTLVNKGNGSWEVTVEAYVTGANVNPYTYTANGSNLGDVLATWFDFVGGASVYFTEVRGIEKENVAWGEVVDNCVVLADYATLDESAKAPDGFEKVYAVSGTFDEDKKSTTDLSAYSEIRFAFKSNSYFLMDGWTIYMQESYTDWATVSMVNNGNNSWTVTVYGNVWDGSATQNPFTITYEGTNIQTILAKWYNGSNIYATEIRGVKA